VLYCGRGLAFSVAGVGFLILSLRPGKQIILQHSCLLKLAKIPHFNTQLMEEKGAITKKCSKSFHSMIFYSKRPCAKI